MLKPVFCSGDYWVDENGRVFNKDMTPVKVNTNHKGYLIVVLTINGKKKLFGIHTLVARAFCDGYETGKQVNHKDGVKTNNHYTNLEWLTPYENRQHAVAVLGYNNRGANNGKARAIVGMTKDGQMQHRFDSLMDAGRYFEPDDPKKARHAQNQIWRVLHKLPGRRTYRKLVWVFSDE